MSQMQAHMVLLMVHNIDMPLRPINSSTFIEIGILGRHISRHYCRILCFNWVVLWTCFEGFRSLTQAKDTSLLM